MEEAYDAAVGQCGGLEAAKPKGVFEAMQATGEFPELTLQVGAGCSTLCIANRLLRLLDSAMHYHAAEAQPECMALPECMR